MNLFDPSLPPVDSFDGEFRFLSNFAPSYLYHFGLQFNSAENAYQAAKTFNVQERELIQFMTPGQSKRAGRTVLLRGDWEEVKIRIMTEIVFIKFAMNPPLRKLLLDTGKRKLIEGNTWGDIFWGVCEGIGQNHLGKILMKVRFLLSDERLTSIPDYQGIQEG